MCLCRNLGLLKESGQYSTLAPCGVLPELVPSGYLLGLFLTKNT